MHLKETEISVKISGLEKKMKYAEIEEVIKLVNPLCGILVITFLLGFE